MRIFSAIIGLILALVWNGAEAVDGQPREKGLAPISVLPAVGSSWPGIDLDLSCYRSLHLGESGQEGKESGEHAIRAKRRWGRALLLNLAYLGGSALWYLAKKEIMKFDCEYEITWADQRKRFFSLSEFKFDDNAFSLNWAHVLQGAVYYDLARMNRLNMGQSFLVALAASSLWEYVVEMRELVSIPDQITTPFGGIVLGEVSFQMADFLGRSKKTLANRLLGFLLGPMPSLHRFLFKDSRLSPASALDEQGYPTDTWHRFELAIGMGGGSSGNDEGASMLSARFHSRLFHSSQYEKEGSCRLYLKTPSLTMFEIDAALRGWREGEIDLTSRLGLGGYLSQEIRASDGRLEGRVFYLGPTSGFDLYSGSWGTFRDRIAACNLIGPLILWKTISGPWRFSVEGSFFVDFAMPQSAAFPTYQLTHDVSGSKSVLKKEGYYYAWGCTSQVGIRFEWQRLGLNTAFGFRAYDSIEGKDRYPEAVTRDFNLRDYHLTWSVDIRLCLSAKPDFLSLFWEWGERGGEIEETSVRFRQSRAGLRFSREF